MADTEIHPYKFQMGAARTELHETLEDVERDRERLRAENAALRAEVELLRSLITSPAPAAQSTSTPVTAPQAQQPAATPANDDAAARFALLELK